MKKHTSILFAALMLAIGLVYGSRTANAQAVYCPAGYSCVPASQVSVSCPFGYTCTPVSSYYSSTYQSYGYQNTAVAPSYSYGATCYAFTRQLSLGSFGNDVANLQSFLIAKGFDIPSVASGYAAKGYFGTQTAYALSAYQRSVGLAATGALDSNTIAQMNSACGSSGGSSGYPGSALRVTSPNGGEVWQRGSVQTITWTGAYGITSQVGSIYLQPSVPACAEPTAPIRCMIMVRAPMLIAQNVNLSQQSYSWTVGNDILSNGQISSSDVTDGQYKIKVCSADSSVCDTSDAYFSVSSSGGSTGGVGPLRVTSPNGGESWQTGSVKTIQWTSPAYFRATYADIKLQRSGPTCTNGMMCPMYMYAPYTIVSGVSINQNSYNWTVGQVLPTVLTNSSYATAPDGQYTVQICETGTSNCDQSDAVFTIYSGGGSGSPGTQSPVISGVDAPTTLAVGQTGTWTVHASDPQNGALSYTVDWGDTAQQPYAMTSVSSGQFTQTTSSTHSYSNAGTYSLTFTVRNSAGLTAQSKTTVYVGSTANQQPITLTSPNGGETWKRGTTQYITWSNQNIVYPYYSGSTSYVSGSAYTNTGYVRITLNYQCPGGVYCTAIYRPPYTIQSSASNTGSSMWVVGSATVDGFTPVSVPSGTYVMTVCRYDPSSAQSSACDSSNSYFTLTD